ncbi:flavin monoamine oxidase family protein [Brachybacterium kimchii]|uniref:FAD-dependent oxidoreductase n=1 Tax=Brachybacterium kimchii TaxID=2942909 RepID=A0ABY4N627_9MICO|nr:NAD(P)/FAD-dependent oxidoreductase [Brachybacterium kimchii]UQN29589.1 FAD-dependent oxidoreductase [Brachybacterium kimchii]
MKDAIVIGAGLAGLSAAWRLRHFDTLVLEADDRVGGRIRSERRGAYWLNWGGHVFAGPDSSTDELLREVGVTAVEIPGSLQGMAMNGTFLRKGHIATYPLRIPMPMADRIATFRAGAKVLGGVARYMDVVRTRPGESGAMRQQRIYDFEGDRSFQDYVGDLPEDAASLFSTTVTRSAGNMDQISAGAGIGYFSLVLGFGQGLNRGIVGGPSTLTRTLAASLGEDLQLGATVHEVVHRPGSVLVRYSQDGVEREEEARTVVVATTADVTHRIGVDLPEDLRDALSRIQYGPHVSTAFLTDETTSRPWDDIYAIAAPKRSFAIALNQASIVRGTESERRPGGSLMTFSPAGLGRALLDLDDEEVQRRHLRDLDQILGHGFADSVVEAETDRWAVASPYSFPGRAALQSVLTRGTDRVFLAGDYLGTLYTESAVTTGFSAAQNAASVLATPVRRSLSGPAADAPTLTPTAV